MGLFCTDKIVYNNLIWVDFVRNEGTYAQTVVHFLSWWENNIMNYLFENIQQLLELKDTEDTAINNIRYTNHANTVPSNGAIIRYKKFNFSIWMYKDFTKYYNNYFTEDTTKTMRNAIEACVLVAIDAISYCEDIVSCRDKYNRVLLNMLDFIRFVLRKFHPLFRVEMNQNGFNFFL
jgi:hypothetical protein